MGGKHHFLNYLAIAQIAVLNIDPVKQNKQKKKLWIWGSLLKTKIWKNLKLSLLHSNSGAQISRSALLEQMLFSRKKTQNAYLAWALIKT